MTFDCATIGDTMSDDSRARFGAGAEAWADYNQQPLGRIRREVTWHNLAPHLPKVAGEEVPPRVLDAPGASGELALRLARQGYRVWLVPSSPATACGPLPTACQPIVSRTLPSLTRCWI
jgi:2-polyprenyl-3-methyl-5-hydroxy-6-metoxy-1,4-benzoquinol methylase